MNHISRLRAAAAAFLPPYWRSGIELVKDAPVLWRVPLALADLKHELPWYNGGPPLLRLTEDGRVAAIAEFGPRPIRMSVGSGNFTTYRAAVGNLVVRAAMFTMDQDLDWDALVGEFFVGACSGRARFAVVGTRHPFSYECSVQLADGTSVTSAPRPTKRCAFESAMHRLQFHQSASPVCEPASWVRSSSQGTVPTLREWKFERDWLLSQPFPSDEQAERLKILNGLISLSNADHVAEMNFTQALKLRGLSMLDRRRHQRWSSHEGRADLLGYLLQALIDGSEAPHALDINLHFAHACARTGRTASVGLQMLVDADLIDHGGIGSATYVTSHKGGLFMRDSSAATLRLRAIGASQRAARTSRRFENVGDLANFARFEEPDFLAKLVAANPRASFERPAGANKA